MPQGAGYDVSWEVINARCLTAQTRKRLFLVGIRRQLSALSEATGHSTTANAGQRREVSPFAFPYIPDLGLGQLIYYNTKTRSRRAITIPLAVLLACRSLDTPSATSRCHSC